MVTGSPAAQGAVVPDPDDAERRRAERLASLHRALDAMGDHVATLGARNAELRAENARLRVRIAELETRAPAHGQTPAVSAQLHRIGKSPTATRRCQDDRRAKGVRAAGPEGR